MELPGGGVGRCHHIAVAVKNDRTMYIIEFGGLNSSDTKLTSTTILQMSKYMRGLM